MSRRQNRASSPTPDRQRRLQHHGQQQAAAAAAGNEFMVQGRQLPLVPKGSKDHKSQQEVLQVPKALAPIKIKGSRDGHQLVQQNMFQGWNQSQLLAAYVEHMQQVNSPLAAVSSGAASPVYYYQGSPIGYAQHPLDWNGLQRQGSSAVGSPNRYVGIDGMRTDVNTQGHNSNTVHSCPAAQEGAVDKLWHVVFCMHASCRHLKHNTKLRWSALSKACLPDIMPWI